jgi:quercetin dioxygenase-like cupin family protein
VRFNVRYFEIARGGFTSLERHRHSHVVFGLRGRGRVRVGEKHYLIGRMDMIYIAPGQSHQLIAAVRGPFGFLCSRCAARQAPPSR